MALSLYDFDFYAWPVEFMSKRGHPMVQLPEPEMYKAQALLQGRMKLIEEHKAVRHKVKTEDGNEIATIVVDRRNNPEFAHGETLGEPFPSQEQHAIDAVIQFAMKRLGFELCDIILFGWSIGGYPVTWAAMNYPQVKGVIVDATFDDIIPLAVARMPPSWGPFVRQTIKDYMHLRNAEQLCR
ncbi:hypothetical protein LSH36_342g03001 [Paralvinella palmiformis]|uniref:Uncharacterized protein n=1 Tax=Paralvinella palmiformis TaxID=53620 RepID=A0AAD9JFX0_9ANNE|nr:hypothetical protein LSH36_342g03001 [Paralvinella palmiformis]